LLGASELSSLRRRSGALLLVAVALFSTFTFWSATTLQIIKAEPTTGTGGLVSTDYEYVDLTYLTSHPQVFKGFPVATRGVVKFSASVYMYEDFWLQAQSNEKIPVVVRFAGLPIPREGSLIEVSGTIEYCDLEGGFFYLNASSLTEVKNVILIGWDGVQRNNLFELLNRSLLPNLSSFVNEGTIANITVMDHRTDTKAGWTQILTGYKWWRTGVFNNAYWFHSIPAGYTIPERVESHFGKSEVVTGFITGKLGHMEAQNGTGSAKTGLYTHEAIYSNIPLAADVCNVGDRNASVVGSLALQFLENYANSHFFAFFHFSDPDSAGHNQQSGGENSALYEQAIERCDDWLGQILNKLNTLNIAQNTSIYITADHGFDEGGYSHNNAPYIFLATNDKNVTRNGDEVDVAPTVYYGLGMWGDSFNPALDGYPLQVGLPEGVEQERQSIVADNTPPPKSSIVSPTSGANLAGTVVIKFNVTDKYLSAVLLLIDNALKTDGPWTWHRNGLVEADGSYNWDTTNINTGSHTITILAFDEHGATNGPSNSTIKVTVVIPELPTIPTPKPSPPPQESPTPHTSPTPQPNNQSATPPVIPPSNNPPVQPWGFLGSSLPMEYGYGIVVVIVVAIAAPTGYLYLKRKK
jgi:hypothetical protein